MKNFLDCAASSLAPCFGVVLDASDFQTITDCALRLFDERMTAVDPAVRGEFDIEVARLESQVVQLYGIAALLARREPEIDRVAEIWAAMISVCDAVAARMQMLCGEHPFCIAAHDKILDVRNKSARLRDLHL